ncbi:MAG: hypothetical protein GF350_14910 [Chitinivibrionales bacterium]|nr:hypothetical protein [Chitinivibrionales bacterium]
MLGEAGITTKIDPDDDDDLQAMWENTEYWPKIGEHATSIAGPENQTKHFSKFCPEVSYEVFGLFVSALYKYADEIDRGNVEKLLSNLGRSFAKDWRWEWAYVHPMHYSECNLYSVLHGKVHSTNGGAMLKQFMKDTVRLQKQDGKEFTEIKASVQSKVILIDDVSLPIEPHDKIFRKLPSGVEEVYVVDDPGYQAGIASIKPHYQIKAHREGTQQQKAIPKTITYNISGSNARVNINSQDYSHNITNASTAEIFKEFKDFLVENISEQEERHTLLAKVEDLEKAVGSESFSDRYKDFIMTAANHMAIIAPFIPALTQFLK